MKHRVVCTCLFINGCLPMMAVAAAPETGMNLPALTLLAQERAQMPYDRNARTVPDFLNELGYDEYRDFKYKPARALWYGQGLPFEIRFFHPGYLYHKTVAMHVVSPSGAVSPIAFTPDLFDYGPQEALIERLPGTLGFSGFHLWQRSAGAEASRIGLFQGASYFRMVSPADEYGLSARAIAVDMTTPGIEEFPGFTDFWFRQPEPGDTDFVFFGLAEGPSVVAAYQFVLTPGERIRIQVEGRVVLRKRVEELGLVPFSTMFWYGENTSQRPADFRPEVHDSDGLFMVTDEQYFWRPIANPPRTRTDILPGSRFSAFGLLQRDRDFEHYQDIEAGYHLRPDAWVVPGETMREGSLRLLEIESPHEYADNVALTWVPTNSPAPGEVFAYDYELFFGERPPPPVAQVVATRYGDSLRADGSIEFVIDFQGGPLEKLPESAKVQISSEIEGGEFIWQNIRKNPYNDTWRLNLRVAPDRDINEVRLRAYLHQKDMRLSETWMYWWQ